MTADDRQKTAEQPRTDPATASAVSGAQVAAPGVGSTSDPDAVAAAAGGGAARADAPEPDSPSSLTDRPEVLAGAAFAGAFLLARILKRLVD